MFYNKN